VDDLKAIAKSKKTARAARVANPPVTRRFRPLGLSIAILSTAGLYGLWPMVPLLLWLLTRLRGHEIGSELLDNSAWFNVVLGAATLIACVMAWVGRPPQTRRTLLALVWFATIVRLVQSAQALSERSLPITSAQVGGSLSSVLQPITLCQIPLLILVPLYITWYLNRAPARAFYKSS
jgi:hypothetical protein